ncbi:MAG: histidine phosphatase family protein [Candidatus Nomurabacteria bacterium]|nr:MAG: histidine phosphatase family protein [Candidatus Nomurabacteria bacterium]
MIALPLSFLRHIHVVRNSSDRQREQIKAINPIQFDDRLRERDFGELNDQPIQSYQEVWDADKAGSAHPDHGIESATMVLHRVMSLIHDELEKRYQGRTFSYSSLTVTHFISCKPVSSKNLLIFTKSFHHSKMVN